MVMTNPPESNPNPDSPRPPSRSPSPAILGPPPTTDDPPPPYPSPRRTRRVRRHVQQVSSNDSDPGERTPLLSPSVGRRRQRRLSVASSTASAAPSLAATIFSLFRLEPDSDDDEGGDDRPPAPPQPMRIEGARRKWSLFSRRAWRRYFGVLGKRAYWAPVFHLMVLNFPYALAAWVYLFVFTLCGTALLMALPLGALLCFFDLIGARLFARGELLLQSTFHSPLHYPPPYPPRPIFVRPRPTPADEETQSREGGGGIWDNSFYRNSYALFTDPTSYTALFYFLVIKPPITFLLSLLLVAVVPAAAALVVPLPAVLVGVRRLGAWQANVAVEGVWVGVE